MYIYMKAHIWRGKSEIKIGVINGISLPPRLFSRFIFVIYQFLTIRNYFPSVSNIHSILHPPKSNPNSFIHSLYDYRIHVHIHMASVLLLVFFCSLFLFCCWIQDSGSVSRFALKNKIHISLASFDQYFSF